MFCTPICTRIILCGDFIGLNTCELLLLLLLLLFLKCILNNILYYKCTRGSGSAASKQGPRLSPHLATHNISTLVHVEGPDPCDPSDPSSDADSDWDMPAVGEIILWVVISRRGLLSCSANIDIRCGPRRDARCHRNECGPGPRRQRAV
jgi:hypothetical protein